MGNPSFQVAKRLGLQRNTLVQYTGGVGTIYPLLLQPYDEPTLDAASQEAKSAGVALANLASVPMGSDLLLMLPVRQGFSYKVLPYYRIRTVRDANRASGVRGFAYRMEPIKVVGTQPNFIYQGLELAPGFTALNQAFTLDDTTMTVNSLGDGNTVASLARGLGLDNGTGGVYAGPYVGAQFKALGDEVGFLIYPSAQGIGAGTASVRDWLTVATDTNLIQALGGDPSYSLLAATGAWLLAGAQAN